MNNCKTFKIFIKLQAFDIKQLVLTTNRITALLTRNKFNFIGPIALPTKKRIYCILRSPHINKDAREHFEIRTFTKIILLNVPNFINMKFFIPSGVKIKLITSKI